MAARWQIRVKNNFACNAASFTDTKTKIYLVLIQNDSIGSHLTFCPLRARYNVLKNKVALKHFTRVVYRKLLYQFVHFHFTKNFLVK